MDHWAYREYREIVEENVSEGLKELGYDINQSIGYAQYQLELRLRECPPETVMAYTALAVAANQRGYLSTWTNSNYFRIELTKAYCNKEHIAIADTLDAADQQEFLVDTEMVSKVLEIVPPA